MEEINENKSFKIELTFIDDDGTARVPESVTYSIYDDISGTFIVEDESFTPTGSTSELPISSENNQILNDNNSFEKRIITIQWTYASGEGHGVEEVEYLCRNLKGIN